ncbi:MAG: hypothetical protein AB7O43_20915 [Hyphomicrobiaceae bacterium]|nr:MAG: hypothetical protein BroJett024_42220 [Alphaproteobacteria bacterium]
MPAVATAIDALFADPNIARDAIWRAGSAGAGIAVRVVTRRPDQVVGFGDSRAVLPTMLIDVRRSEVSDPATGDTVKIESETFEVIATPTIDSLRLVWTCEAAPPP